MTNARLAAVRVLVALEAGRTTLAAEVERERPDLTDRRDQALFFELATGATRWRDEIDARLAPHCRRPLASLVPELRAILRLATYQLHHLDRIPEHAIVNEAVELTRAVKQPYATGFVNAVLRNLVRARNKPAPLPARPSDPSDTERALDYLSVALSHPRWLVARWLTRVGFDATERWCQLNNTPPDIAVRPLGVTQSSLLERLQAEGIDAAPGAFAPGAVRLPPGALSRIAPATRQLLFVQDEASQLVAQLVGAAPGETVLDVCAAPGGKTVIIEQAVRPTGRVFAGDIRFPRVALLRETLARAAAPTRVLAHDVEAGLPFGPVFDRVFLDAPCSGLGVVRRDPDIKWTRQPGDLTPFADAQGRMLTFAAQVVRPGGALVYSTCSSEPDENEAVVDYFLASTPAFRLVPLVAPPALVAAADTIDARGFLRTLPFRDGLDAFFAALLVRREGA